MVKESKKYTYCPDCFTDDKDGYKGKRCKWCCALLIKDPLDKLFMGKNQSIWFNKGRRNVLRELEFYLKQNKYPINNPIRKKIFALSELSEVANEGN